MEETGDLSILVSGPTNYPIIGITLEYLQCYDSISK